MSVDVVTLTAGGTQVSSTGGLNQARVKKYMICLAIMLVLQLLSFIFVLILNDVAIWNNVVSIAVTAAVVSCGIFGTRNNSSGLLCTAAVFHGLGMVGGIVFLVRLIPYLPYLDGLEFAALFLLILGLIADITGLYFAVQLYQEATNVKIVVVHHAPQAVPVTAQAKVIPEQAQVQQFPVAVAVQS